MHAEFYVAALGVIEILETGLSEFLPNGLVIRAEKYFPETIKYFKRPEQGYYSAYFKGIEGLENYVQAVKTFEKELEENFQGWKKILRAFIYCPFNSNIKELYFTAKLDKCDNKREIYQALLHELKYRTDKDQGEILNEMAHVGGAKGNEENKLLIQRFKKCLAKS